MTTVLIISSVAQMSSVKNILDIWSVVMYNTLI